MEAASTDTPTSTEDPNMVVNHESVERDRNAENALTDTRTTVAMLLLQLA